MQSFLEQLISCSVIMSVLILLMMAITPYLEKRYAAKWRYYAWLVIVIGLVVPFRPDFSVFINMDLPAPSMNIRQIVPAESVTMGMGTESHRPAIPTIRWDQAGFFLWLLGTATVMTYHAVQHFRFMKMINRWCEDITNHATVDSLQKLKKELGISRDVQLKVCPFVQSPMLIGLRRPAIILPSASFRPHEFGFHFEA